MICGMGTAGGLRHLELGSRFDRVAVVNPQIFRQTQAFIVADDLRGVEK